MSKDLLIYNAELGWTVSGSYAAFFPAHFYSVSKASRAARESNPQFFSPLSCQLWGRFQVTSHTDGKPPHSRGAISKRLSPQTVTLGRWIGLPADPR